MLDVLVDMTALNTPSRERGIGRYVKHLCRALAARDTWPEAATAAARFASRGCAASWPRAGRARRIAAICRRSADPGERLAVPAAQARAALVFGRPGAARWPEAFAFARPTGHADRHATTADRDLPRSDPAWCSPSSTWRRLPGARTLQWLRDYARYRTARRVIAISEATRRDLIEHVGVAPERIDVVHSGVDHERFSASARDGERDQVVASTRLRGAISALLGRQRCAQESAALGARVRAKWRRARADAGLCGADFGAPTRALARRRSATAESKAAC